MNPTAGEAGTSARTPGESGKMSSSPTTKDGEDHKEEDSLFTQVNYKG